MTIQPVADDSLVKEQFLKDIELSAGIVGSAFNKALTERLVTFFEPEFKRHVVQWKLTDVADSPLYYRFLSTDHVDHARRALESGLFNCTNGLLLNLQDEVLKAIPGAVRSGVDFDVVHGLAKVWTFTTPVPTDVALRIPNLPDALLNKVPLLKKLGLEGVGFVASDFAHGAMTMYFGWHSSPVTRDWLRRLEDGIACDTIDEQMAEDIVKSAARLRGVSVTVDWQHPEAIRWGIYRFGLTYNDANQCPDLPKLSSRLQALVNLAPTLNRQPCYHLAWSLGAPQNYIKLEKNYSENVYEFLSRERGINLL